MSKKSSTLDLTADLAGAREDLETMHSDEEADAKYAEEDQAEEEEEEDLPKDAIEWKIDAISKKKGKIYSDPKVTGECKWRIMMFPRGNSNPDFLSVYVEIANVKELKPGWSYNGSFTLELVNTKDPEDTFHHSSQPLFLKTFLNRQNKTFLFLTRKFRRETTRSEPTCVQREGTGLGVRTVRKTRRDHGQESRDRSR